MEFMNSRQAATVRDISDPSSCTLTGYIQESELQDKILAEQARLAAQHQAIEGAQAQLLAKQVEQDKVAAALHEQEALLMEREAAVEKHRTAVENQQGSKHSGTRDPSLKIFHSTS